MMAELDPLKLEPGQMVDGWRIVRLIGKGGYAVVYEVEKNGQRFALKIACQAEQSGDLKQTDARARREVACLQQLNHRHIIRLWAQGRWPDPRSGFLYIVLDLVEGYTLARWVEQTHPTPHQIVVLFRKLFDALMHMHGHNVLHRDLSTRNIMVSLQGEPVIIDFGVADYATAEELTNGPIPPGTPRNRSPQAVRFWKENRLNPKARYAFQAIDDLFALGADLYDVLTDPTPTHPKVRPPLGHEAFEPPSPHKATGGRVPLELSAYAMKLLRHKPEERYATAQEAMGPLEEFARFGGPEWRETRVHPVAAQLPPEAAEAAALPGEAALAPSAVRAAEGPRPRRALPSPMVTVPLALGVLAIAVAAFVLLRPVPHAASSLAEKPTSPPTRLASPLPTQQEASPSVNQPGNTPTLTSGVPNPPQPQKTQERRVLSRTEKCALLVATLAWFEAGCAGVQTQPAPGDCSEEAMRVMRQELGWVLNSPDGPFILLDVTKGDAEEARENPLTVWKDGPVTGALIEPLGKAPAGMRLDGHLWTTGDFIYGRYIRAHLRDGRTVPICVELTDGGRRPGIDKKAGSKPGHAVGRKVAQSMAVDERWLDPRR
ncbi:serine/threonine protein kinase [Hyalangium versicolor]|uniref:serine/threonine protein kinase n=1 Tax=Hyalangium versicolor TaxID=2861190 RepID=UPI001CC91D6D|nr:serine/threonine protein kinase [Hyalangium versicolor]